MPGNLKQTSITETKIYGFQRGVVIKNCDPLRRGRVKIFLPSIARQLLTNLAPENKQWCLKYLGDKILTDTPESANQATENVMKVPDEYLHTIAGVLDWVDQASPLVGSGSIAQYDAVNKMSTTSDKSYATDEGKHGSGERLAAQKKQDNSISSGQGDRIGIHAGKVDVHAYNQKPPSYNNSAKGMFSIPRVGSHVWVFFEDGDMARPVYFAYSYNEAEWQSVQAQNTCNPDLHSPSNALKENDPQGGKMYTGKTVWNERGGVVEIINTDDFEGINISDYKGSHISMNKFGITESTAPGTNKKLEVNGDYFIDVKGDYVLRVKGEKQVIMEGYEHRVHGNLRDAKYQQEWLDKAAPVLQNAARRASVPNFQPLQKQINDASGKKAPNNSFSLPADLSFKESIIPTKVLDFLKFDPRSMIPKANPVERLGIKII